MARLGDQGFGFHSFFLALAYGGLIHPFFWRKPYLKTICGSWEVTKLARARALIAENDSSQLSK